MTVTSPWKPPGQTFVVRYVAVQEVGDPFVGEMVGEGVVGVGVGVGTVGVGCRAWVWASGSGSSTSAR